MEGLALALGAAVSGVPAQEREELPVRWLGGAAVSSARTWPCREQLLPAAASLTLYLGHDLRRHVFTQLGLWVGLSPSAWFVGRGFIHIQNLSDDGLSVCLSLSFPHEKSLQQTACKLILIKCNLLICENLN